MVVVVAAGVVVVAVLVVVGGVGVVVVAKPKHGSYMLGFAIIFYEYVLSRSMAQAQVCQCLI